MPNLYFSYAAPETLVLFPKGHRAQAAPRLARVGGLAQARNVDLVFDRMSPAWQGRIASLTKELGRTTYGTLWEIKPSEWPQIEAMEASLGGPVEAWTIEVEVDGKLHKATAYSVLANRRDTKSAISTAYYRELIGQLESLGAPEAYLTHARAELAIAERVERAKQLMHLP